MAENDKNYDCDPNHFEPEFVNELQVAMMSARGEEIAARCARTDTVTIPAATGFKAHLKDNKNAYRKKKTEMVFSDKSDICVEPRVESCKAATKAWKARMGGA